MCQQNQIIQNPHYGICRCAIPVVFIHAARYGFQVSHNTTQFCSFLVFIHADDMFRPLFQAIFRSQDVCHFRKLYNVKLIDMGPCIVIIFQYISPNKTHTLQSLFYPKIALHVSGIIITHLQEHKTTVTTASGNRCTVIHATHTLKALTSLPQQHQTTKCYVNHSLFYRTYCIFHRIYIIKNNCNFNIICKYYLTVKI